MVAGFRSATNLAASLPRTSTGQKKRALRRARDDGTLLVRRALKTLALQALALQLARPTNRLCGFTRATLGRLLEVAAQLHLAKDTLTLHLLLECLERLIDIVVTDENLHLVAYSFIRCALDGALA